MSLTCIFLANCGLLLQHNGASLLVDAPCGMHTQFDGTSQEEFEKMCQSQPPYNGLCGMIFTHTHADHFDRKRVRELADSRPGLSVVIPGSGEMEMQLEKFGIKRFCVPHSGEEFANVAHHTLLISCGERNIYITGDADWTSPVHQEVIKNYHPDVGIWNPNFVNHEEGRALLSAIPQNFINHMPIHASDVFGIGRKCRTTFAKMSDSLQNACLIDDYPIVKEL